MPPVVFEPTISEGERPQTYALDRAAAGTSYHNLSNTILGNYRPKKCSFSVTKLALFLRATTSDFFMGATEDEKYWRCPHKLNEVQCFISWNLIHGLHTSTDILPHKTVCWMSSWMVWIIHVSSSFWLCSNVVSCSSDIKRFSLSHSLSPLPLHFAIYIYIYIHTRR
jgi:hypothetical protein